MNTSLPVPAALNIRLAMSALDLASEFLTLAIDARDDDAYAAGCGLCRCELCAIRATCRYFANMLRPASDPLRSLGIWNAFSVMLDQRSEDPRNLPGLERAEFAVAFCVASLDEAIEAIAEGDEWNERCTVAAFALNAAQGRLTESLADDRPTGDEFFGPN